MTVKLFWKQDCPKCPAAKSALAGVEDIEYYDLGESAGLAEAAFYSVMSTPSIVISGPDGVEIASYRGEVPTPAEISRWL